MQKRSYYGGSKRAMEEGIGRCKDRWTNCEFYQIGALNFNGCMCDESFLFFRIYCLDELDKVIVGYTEKRFQIFFLLLFHVKIIFFGKNKIRFFSFDVQFSWESNLKIRARVSDRIQLSNCYCYVVVGGLFRNRYSRKWETLFEKKKYSMFSILFVK